jgi:hypothetical protein
MDDRQREDIPFGNPCRRARAEAVFGFRSVGETRHQKR